MYSPKFMQPGSYGTGVQLLLLALLMRGYTAKLTLDCDLGDVGVGHLKNFQKDYGLESDGGFGPETREFMLHEFEFNFEEALLATSGSTLFVQPDGSGLLFNPAVRDSTYVTPQDIEKTREGMRRLNAGSMAVAPTT